MDREALLDRLRGVEWDDFEVKEAGFAVPDDAYKTVSAFSNSAGGWIVLGVREETGRFVPAGVQDPDRLQNEFLTACRSAEKFSRPVDVRPRLYDIDGATVLAFYVPPASRFDKPIKVKVRKYWETYIRVGSGDHKCSSEEEARFLRDASHETFDGTPCTKATIPDLHQPSIRWLRGLIAQRAPEQAHPDLSVDEYLETAGLLTAGGHVTHAAALLFGGEKLLARLKPGGVLDFRVLRTEWSETPAEQRWDDRALCEGNLVETLRTMIERLARLFPEPFALDGESLQRQAGTPDYRALREALVNLLVHQDYSDVHRTASVVWYADRVTFDNPGDSFVDVAQMLDGGSSNLRNPLLARFFRRAGFAEQAGTGIPAIVRAWRGAARVPPTIENDAGQKRFRLTLEWKLLSTPRDGLWLRRLGVQVSPDAVRILTAARQLHRLGRTGARLTTGASVRVVTNLLSELVNQRLLVPVEDAETGVVYRLADHVSALWEEVTGSAEPVTAPVTEPVSSAAEPDTPLRGSGRTRADLLALIQQQPGLRAPALAATLGWSAAAVKRGLAALRTANAVEYVGPFRTGGYHAITPESPAKKSGPKGA